MYVAMTDTNITKLPAVVKCMLILGIKSTKCYCYTNKKYKHFIMDKIMQVHCLY